MRTTIFLFMFKALKQIDIKTVYSGPNLFLTLELLNYLKGFLMYCNSFIYFYENFSVKSSYNSSMSRGITLGSLENSRES